MGRSNSELGKGIFHEDNLLFHGTDLDLKPGDTILPAQKAGVKPVWENLGVKGEVAYATPDPGAAQFFARDASRVRHNDGAHSKVYEVEPINPSDVTQGKLLGQITQMGIDSTPEGERYREPAELKSPTGFRVKRQAWGADKELCRDCGGHGHRDEYVQTSSAGERVQFAKTGNRVHCDLCSGTGLMANPWTSND